MQYKSITVLALILFVSACTPAASASPTLAPTSTSIPSTGTPVPTSTNDPNVKIFEGLQDEGLNISRDASVPPGQFELLFNGEPLPGALLDKMGLHIQISDEQQIIVPVDRVSERVNVVDGAVVVDDASGNALAVFDTGATGGANFLGHEYELVNWRERWVSRSEVISGDPNTPVEIATWEDFFAIAHYEAYFLEPNFPDNVYFPQSENVWIEYQKDSPEAEFSSKNPLGGLVDLNRSPFRLGVNNIVLLPNDVEGRGIPECITTEIVANKSGGVSRLHFSRSYDKHDRCLNFLKGYVGQERRAYLLPTHTVDGDDLRISVLDRNRRIFWKKFGYLGPNGDLILVKPLVIQWVNDWQVPEEMRFILFALQERNWK